MCAHGAHISHRVRQTLGRGSTGAEPPCLRSPDTLAGMSTPSTPSINHLVLNVRDIERSHRFYTEVMGFEQCGDLTHTMTMRFYRGDPSHHHDLALTQIENPDQVPPPEPWAMAPTHAGVNHIAIGYPDRESWLSQLRHMKAHGVEVIVRGNHGMTHSAYIADPDGYGLEVLYNVPADVWEGDVDAALNYFEYLDPDDLDDRVDYQRFGARRDGADTGARADRHPPDRHQLSASPAELLEVAVAAARAGGAVLVDGLGRPVHVDHKNERTSHRHRRPTCAAQAAIVEVITAYDSAPRDPRRGGPRRRRREQPHLARRPTRRNVELRPRRAAGVHVGRRHGRRGRRRGSDLRAVPRRAVHGGARRRGVARRATGCTSRRRRPSTRRSSAPVCSPTIHGRSPTSDSASPSSPAAAGAFAASARRRCAWRTSPPAASTPSWRPTRRTRGTSAPAPC